MRVIKQDSKIKEAEKQQELERLAEEAEKSRTLKEFRRAEAYKYIMEIIDQEIEKAADVRTIPSDARNLTETAKLLIINQRALVVLENIKKRIKG